MKAEIPPDSMFGGQRDPDLKFSSTLVFYVRQQKSGMSYVTLK